MKRDAWNEYRDRYRRLIVNDVNTRTRIPRYGCRPSVIDELRRRDIRARFASKFHSTSFRFQAGVSFILEDIFNQRLAPYSKHACNVDATAELGWNSKIRVLTASVK